MPVSAAWLRAIAAEREAAFDSQIRLVAKKLTNWNWRHADQPLRFRARCRAGVRVSSRRNVVEAQGPSCAAALCDRWFSCSQSSPLTWTVELKLEAVHPEMAIGVCSQNYQDGCLTTSRHGVVARASDGAIFHKGTATSLVLRPMRNGDTVRLTVDMQACELTFELLSSGEGLGKSCGAIATVERLPNNVTIAVGLRGSPEASPLQRVRIVSSSSERPVRAPERGLWDADDNAQPPLHQRPTYKNMLSWRDRAPVHCALEEASVASSLG